MDENSKKTAEKVFDDKLAKTQFTPSPVPFHKHTGIDSPQLNYTNILSDGIDATIIITTAINTTTMTFRRGLLTAVTQV